MGTRCLAVDLVDDCQMEKGEIIYKVPVEGNLFFPNKCKNSGKSIGNCIKYKDRWISPPEFESLAGLHGRKWRTNIRYAGKPIGQWLAEHEVDPSSQKSEVLQPITCISDVDNNASLSASLSTSLSNPEVTLVHTWIHL